VCSDSSSNPKPPFRGILVTRGMEITVADLQIRFDADGQTSSSMTLKVGLNMCPIWLHIAFQHLVASEEAHHWMMDAHKRNDDEAIGAALNEEATSGMQAIVTSCTAVDSFYASVKDRVPVPKELAKDWQQRKAPRYAQLAEVFRRAFTMGERSAQGLREALEQNFRFRGRATHPPAAAAAPVMYAEIERGVEWRLAEFRFDNARQVAGLNLSVIAQLAGQPPRPGSEAVQELATSTKAQIATLLPQWEQRFGPVLPVHPQSS
jgi:hypothetical protein